jgi:hypothetical protein
MDDRLFIACYSNATATIREGIDGRRHFVISGELNDFNARKNGSFRSIYQTKIFTTADLTDYPEPLPFADFDRPSNFGEKDWTPLLNPTKSEWKFDRTRTVITGRGLGLARIAIGPTTGVKFWFSSNSFLHAFSNGSAIALGEAASLAVASFPETPSLVDGVSFGVDVYHSISLTSLA